MTGPDLEAPVTPDPATAPTPRETLVGDRTISPIAGRFGKGLGGRAVMLGALVVGCGVFVAATWHGPKSHAAPEPDQPARQVVPFEPLQAPTLAAPGRGAPRLDKAADAVPALTSDPGNGPTPAGARPGGATSEGRAAIRAAPMIAYNHNAAPFAAEAAATAERVPPIASPPTELELLRQGSRVGTARASRLPDRNFLIVAGTALPCLLQTAMDTATPGYVSCLVPRDVLSDNGAVVLLEKGTRVLGEYRSSLKPGQNRLFVLWTRAVTPAGVAIRLESPAADALGRAGFDGELDTHFWDRFGGALLLSIVDGGGNALSGRDGGGGAVRLPSDAAAVALQGSLNIPPSLRKPQGAEVSIFVAQDFDFSGVYGLKARAP